MTDVGLSIQERLYPGMPCFGCGRTNTKGLNLLSYPDGDGVIATFTAHNVAITARCVKAGNSPPPHRHHIARGIGGNRRVICAG